MALYRLAVPALPAALFVCSALAGVSPAWATFSRVTAACALSSFVLATMAGRAAEVGSRRLALSESARPSLAGARCIAALDVGWGGAASSSQVLDLAGVTDPAVARLAGGHTSKRIPADLLERRGVDTFLLLLGKGQALRTPWWSSHFERAVERRVASFGRELVVRSVELVPLGGTAQDYAIVRLRR